MRVNLAPDSINERLGLMLGKVPLPVGQTFFGMPAARAVGVAQETGVFRSLAAGPRDAASLAERLGLHARALEMLLDVLAGQGLLDRRGGSYSLSSEGRRWVDPESPTYIGTFLEHSLDYWDWWGDLSDVLRSGPRPMQDHGLDAGDPSWAVYIRGQYELARLSAGDVARAIPVRSGTRSVLDVAGGHGYFAAALCRRHPGLRATVLDLPGSVAVGRSIITEAGAGDVVSFVEGDMLTSPLGGPHDVVLAFSILHHLGGADRALLLLRLRDALAGSGGTLAILDMFRPSDDEPRRASGAIFSLFFHLTSGADVLSEAELQDHLREAGFGVAKRHDVRSIPDYRLYTAQPER